MIFIDFFVDFSDFARTTENPFIDPSKDQRNNAKRDNNCTKIAGFTVCAKKKGEFQISGLVGLCNSVPGKGMLSAFLSPFYTTQ